MELQLRLQILKDAEQISEATQSGITRVIEMFDREYGIKLIEENGAMLVTHLAVACERIKRGELVDAIDEFIYQEIRENPHFQKAQEAVKMMEKELQLEIPEREQPFIIMHLCVLFGL
jgi:transcriptional regulatory protein LevR